MSRKYSKYPNSVTDIHVYDQTNYSYSHSLGRKEKQDRSSSRGGRTVQNPSRPAQQPVPEEKGKDRDPQVGDIDSQGFGIGVVPSHLQATQGNPVTTAAKKSSKSTHSNQQVTGAQEVGRDQLANQDTSSSSLSSLRELTDAPPTKQEVCYRSFSCSIFRT